jgi:predicted enzyme related to lactoylglutathione lyase
MSHPFTPRVGAVMSADIAVPEHEREVAFYSRALTTGDAPFWKDDLMNNLGMPVIGLGQRVPEYESLPLQWMPHIQVDDIAASAARALELGGTEVMHGKDDSGASQWAVMLDPNGAAFGLISVVPAESVPEIEEGAQVGSIAWLDLTVPNAEVTRDFYCPVVGWTTQDHEMTDDDGTYHDYVLVGGDGKPVGGICHARGINQGVPPVWMMYLPVGDIDTSIARVKEDGGTVIKHTDGNCGYNIAFVQDPVGVHFGLIQS